ncbi:hypothetical protein [Gordonia sp. NPDC003585]|uniref:hypothetical protein n=1 Tax=Gordonia sp. NPDC003585 TaxID=3154275 RepID=UPI0033BF9548
MSDFIKKVKEEARAVSAAIDNELTVLEGVDGYDPLAHRDAEESGAEESGAEESGAAESGKGGTGVGHPGDDAGSDDAGADDDGVARSDATPPETGSEELGERA